MMSPAIRNLVFGGIATTLIAIPVAASVTTSSNSDVGRIKPMALQYARVQCMTDDGHGRMRPCSVAYMRQYPNWRSSNDCVTDDGYGRIRPCSASYKKRHEKAK